VAAPWFHYNPNGEGAVVLGTYLHSGLPSVVWKDQGTHRTFYSCNAELSGSMWRSIAEAAGIHFYQSATQQDFVEVRGQLLMVHVGPSTKSPDDPAMSRTYNLPWKARVVDESNNVVCSSCDQFEMPPMRPGATVVFTVTRSRVHDVNRTLASPALKTDDKQSCVGGVVFADCWGSVAASLVPPLRTRAPRLAPPGCLVAHPSRPRASSHTAASHRRLTP
jgi:hypothetical protein